MPEEMIQLPLLNSLTKVFTDGQIVQCTFGGAFSIASLSKSSNGGGGTLSESRIGFTSPEYS